MPKIITGGMPDTMEYFSMFHLELAQNGYYAMLYVMLYTIMMMIVMTIQFDRIVKIIDECKGGHN